MSEEEKKVAFEAILDLLPYELQMKEVIIDKDGNHTYELTLGDNHKFVSEEEFRAVRKLILDILKLDIDEALGEGDEE